MSGSARVGDRRPGTGTRGRATAGAARPRPRRLLAASGDPSDPGLMSGLPYHFALHGRRAGLLDGTATVTPPAWRVRPHKLGWNAYRALTLRGYRGYQYSRRRNERLWPGPYGAGDVILNTFQLYPRAVLEGPARRWYFVDQTLRQLFEAYGQGAQLAPDVVARTVAWEREGYARAEHVIANSRWAAASLVEDYGVEPGRVGVVLQAANVDPDAYAAWAAAHVPRPVDPEGPLRLVFVGGDWRRKGLDRLVLALGAVNRGAPRPRLVLDVLGLRAEEVPGGLAAVPHVTWHGFVDKRDQRRFLGLVAAADVGCLLSRAEAGGNSLREYHAVGLAVLGTTAGGAADQTLPAATWLVAPDEPVTAVAERLRALAADPAGVQARKDAAWAARERVLWPETLRGVAALLAARGA